MTPFPTLEQDMPASDALAELMEQAESLRAELRALGRFGSLVGGSAAMQGLYDQVSLVAKCGTDALITGEAGTGKALVARTIHNLGHRRRRLFLIVECRAMPPRAIERELFGRGDDERAAHAASGGSIERARGGTLFLAHVDQLPVEMQIRLLSALEARGAGPSGRGPTLATGVCVLASTCRDPRDAAATGAIDAGLLQRLAAQVVQVPALRARGNDIELLADHFLRSLNAAGNGAKVLTPAAITRLLRRRWPGNVRELAHAVEHAFAIADGEWITHLDALRDARDEAEFGGRSFQVNVGDRLDAVERCLILATLQHTHTKEAAARILGVSIKTLYNRLRAYGPRPDPARNKAQASATVPMRRTTGQ